MVKNVIINKYADLTAKLSIDCEKCNGLCCVALFFAKTDGFPEDKEPGKPCKNLASDFRCSIYAQLSKSKMKGCLAYDCFGAGQRVTQAYSTNADWKDKPQQVKEIFAVFLIMFQMHQLLWYLLEALTIASDEALITIIESLIIENEKIAARSPIEILSINIENHRTKVNKVLRKVSEMIAAGTANGIKNKDFFGKNLKKTNLDGSDLSMSCMIAADLEGCSLRGTNFLGVDMRDAKISNTDLSESIFLTQMQINSARGNSNTKLPANLSLPATW